SGASSAQGALDGVTLARPPLLDRHLQLPLSFLLRRRASSLIQAWLLALRTLASFMPSPHRATSSPNSIPTAARLKQLKSASIPTPLPISSRRAPSSP